MAKNATQVRVALTGSVWFSTNLAATIPGDLAATPADFVDLGYTTEDGVTFTLSRETEDITGWQTADILRKLVTSEPKSAKFTLHQVNRDTWLAAAGGTITQTRAVNGAIPAVYRWEPTAGQVVEGILLVDFVDGVNNYRFGFRRASQTGEIEFALVRGDSMQLPLEWTALSPTSGTSFFMDTDDVSFAANPADLVPPVAGTLVASSIAATTFTLTVTGASDVVGLHATPYSVTTDDGATWTAWQTAAAHSITGKVTATGYVCQHKVKDAAGNISYGPRIAVKTA